ncbi:undecaprenyl-diphosphatase 4 [Alicyclobacillus cellulosilyticus]|uniref:Undecaprenyl-diphosphatase n=1 Tax=Alicyclobacillus cellulosilyticus TaxID=1003997 RepID=A0A917KAS1_9BACL|nr:undecaprenyl-diphosphate phosphatase [Alicyclobacillus cellulosilyticus]GGJ07399.1 undecaprenyl-diphosphatase 4 [Alicyclobacillus cellulosilyticus]
MTVWQGVVLGLVQGMTEFLPVSSTGHLVLLQKLWSLEADSLWFITMLHLGTLVAVVWVLRREVVYILTHPGSREARLVLTAVVPAAVIGAGFEDMFDRLFASGVTIGVEFVITGIILWWMDGVPAGRKDERSMTFMDALWIGIAQGAAILPALSRSGLTIASGLWRGLDRSCAGRFSFLVSIPAILGATLFEGWDGLRYGLGMPAQAWSAAWWGTVAACISGYLAVRTTMWLVAHSKMRWFAVYVWCLAGMILADQLLWHRYFPPLFASGAIG